MHPVAPIALECACFAALGEDEIVLFGGDTGGVLSSEAWSWHARREQEWQQLEVSGALPLPRCGHAAGVLPTRSAGAQLLVYGGGAADSSNSRLRQRTVALRS